MEQQLHRPTWNRTKIFGSKGRTAVSGDAGSGDLSACAGRTDAYPNTTVNTGDTTPDTTRQKRRTRRESKVAGRFKSARWRAGTARCDSCGWQPPVMLGSVRTGRLFRMLHAHHVLPLCAGGKDHECNLVLLCPNHHAIAHALGTLARVTRKRIRQWTGPKDPEALLNELRWVEHDFDRWVAHCASGRDHVQSWADERRAAMAVVHGGAA